MFTNNNTSTIIALFCDFTFNSWISGVDQRILQDFSSLPYECEFAEFFFCLLQKKKKPKQIDSMLPRLDFKCGKNENRWHTMRIRVCHKRWIDVLCYSLLNRLTAKWNIFVLYNKKERKTTNLLSTTWLFKDRHYPSYKRHVSSLLLLFFFI